ncbi:MAG: hypothetical protein ACRDJH_23595 [Thermomicrobiales bacterium]
MNRTTGIRRRPEPRAGPRRLIDLEPTSAYELVTRQMVESLSDDLREIKGRLNGVLWMVAGAMVVELALRLVGLT